SLWALRTILNPALLMPWVALKPEKPFLHRYPKLFDFFYQKGFGPTDLFCFAYDWRAGIEAAATDFATFVNERVTRGSSVYIIAHSLGCLVARWAIGSRLIADHRVKMVINAGPPFLGSARAFKSVIEMPEIDSTLDRLLSLASKKWPQFAERIVH